jgi:hypothetical protein
VVKYFVDEDNKVIPEKKFCEKISVYDVRFQKFCYYVYVQSLIDVPEMVL